MKVLELFAGKGSIKKACNELGYECFSVDWVGGENIDFVIDIEDLKISDIPFIPDIIWASPDCTTYSIAAISKHRDKTQAKTDYAKKCDSVNLHFINIIKEYLKINADLIFYIENPVGMFRKMPFVRSFIRKTVWYCQYGDTRAKPTDIFTNNQDFKPKICRNNNPHCTHERAKRGSKTGTQGVCKQNRSLIPHKLCLEVLKINLKQPKND